MPPSGDVPGSSDGGAIAPPDLEGRGSSGASASGALASDAPASDVAAPAGAAKSGTDVQAYIGRQLRAVYDDVVKQPIPERFLALMKQLEDGAREP